MSHSTFTRLCERCSYFEDGGTWKCWGKNVTSHFEGATLWETGSDPTHEHLYSSINSLDFKQEPPDLCNSWQEKNLALYLNWWSPSGSLHFLIHSWSHMVIFHISPTGHKCLWFPSYSFSLPLIFILLWLIIPFSATASDQLLFRFSLLWSPQLSLLSCHKTHQPPHPHLLFKGLLS